MRSATAYVVSCKSLTSKGLDKALKNNKKAKNALSLFQPKGQKILRGCFCFRAKRIGKSKAHHATA
jgi:hypothetical protein